MHTNLPKKYLSYPALPKVSAIGKLAHKAVGMALFPLYWLVACTTRTPGLRFRVHCALMGMRLLLRGGTGHQAYSLIVSPIDSVRYFEFDFMWRAVRNMEMRSYLDISSPRVFPLIVADRTFGLIADFVNPDTRDLSETMSFARSLGILDRCRFHATLVESISLEPSSFDVITSISVIEHILDDTNALRKIWDLLKPNGKLLISVPCAAKASEEYSSVNEYGLLSPDNNGVFFWQRYYDEELLRERLYCVTGEPRRHSIYGEIRSGSYERNMARKRTDPFYPYWREPLMMGLEYENKDSISDLPGIGVIAMEFVK